MLVKQVYNLETLIKELEDNKKEFSYVDIQVNINASWYLDNKIYNFELRSPHIMEVSYFLNDDTTNSGLEVVDEINEIISSSEFKEFLYMNLSQYSNSLRSYKKRVKKLK